MCLREYSFHLYAILEQLATFADSTFKASCKSFSSALLVSGSPPGSHPRKHARDINKPELCLDTSAIEGASPKPYISEIEP